MLRYQDEKIRQMLTELGQALAQAIVHSSDVSGAMRKIRQEGYSLYVQLDCKGQPSHCPPSGEPEPGPQLEFGLQARACLPANATRPAALPPAKPTFRLNSRDVDFLKSIGIDPTRAARRRRSSSR